MPAEYKTPGTRYICGDSVGRDERYGSNLSSLDEAMWCRLKNGQKWENLRINTTEILLRNKMVPWNGSGNIRGAL